MGQRGKEKIFQIHEPINIRPRPDEYEYRTAKLMAAFLQSDIEFVVRGSSTTPDILAIAANQFWEIKNIRGNSANTIHNNLKSIDRQSENVVITLFRSRMSPKMAESEIRRHFLRATRVKRAILITKSGNVIVIRGRV